MTIYFLNNVYLLFLPAYISYILQPLDLSCFSSLKTAYRRLMNDYITLTDTTKVGKAAFLKFYTKARESGLREDNIRSGWKATGLYPENMAKPLESRWVVVPQQSAISPPIISNILSPKCGSDIIKQFAKKQCSPTSRLFVRKTSTALDRSIMENTMKDRENERLRIQLEQAKPPKRRKVV